MAIEPVQAGYFVPNKAGYPAVLAEEPKSAVTKVADKGLEDSTANQQDASDVDVTADDGLGGNVNVTA